MSICLALSKDVSVQDLIAFSPLTAVGVLAFSAATLFVIKTRISQMAVMIILSAIFGFVAAIIDFARVVESSIQIHDESHLTAIIFREIILSASITLRFLFIWHVVALPARTEVARPLLPSRLNGSSFLPEPEMHSGCWLRWGIVGLVLKYFLLASVFTIGVLEAVWRLEYVFDFNALTAVIWASAALEIAVTMLFTLKLLGNLLFTPAELRRGVIVDYIPILFALALSLGLALGTLIIFRFSESAIGRLIQGLETYILITYTLVVAFDDVGAPTISNGPISKRARAAESFSAVRVSAAETLLPITPKRPAFRVSLKNERSSAHRIASLVSRRLSGRPDTESLRLWSQRDIEAVTSDAKGTSPVIRSGAENSRVDSIVSYYFAEEDLKGYASLVETPRSVAGVLPYDDAPPVPAIVLSRQTEIDGEYSIYGLNGAIDEDRAHNEIAIETPNSAVAASTLTTLPIDAEGSALPPNRIVRRAEDICAVAGLKLQDSHFKTKRASASNSERSEHSPGSAFTLESFPVPPTGNPQKSLSAQTSTSLGREVDGMAFDMIAPRMPKASRQSSFPSTTRGSDIPGLDAVLISSSTKTPRRYEGCEITSFLDGFIMNENGMTSLLPENGLSNLPYLTPRASMHGLRTRQPHLYNNSISHSPLQESAPLPRSDPSFGPLRRGLTAHQPSLSLDISPSRKPHTVSPEESGRPIRRPTYPPRFESPRAVPTIMAATKSRSSD